VIVQRSDPTAALSAVLPGTVVACAAGAESGLQGRGAAHTASRGRGAAAPGEPAAGGLGRPRRACWTRAAAAPTHPARVVRPARNAAALASRPGPTPLELPAPAGSPGCGRPCWRRRPPWCRSAGR
jgi:hypothetical protein